MVLTIPRWPEGQPTKVQDFISPLKPEAVVRAREQGKNQRKSGAYIK